MFLMTLVSAFFLMTSPTTAIIHQQHLETAEGRVQFLENKLAPFTTAANQLNHEIQILAKKIEALSPERDQAQIIALSEEVSQKMAKLIPMLPVLNDALSINEDFQQMDAILKQKEPLSKEQQQIVDRITSLCRSLDNL